MMNVIMEKAYLNFGFEKAQAMLGTEATGSDFLQVYEDASLEKREEILAAISEDVEALKAERKVPAAILRAAIETVQGEVDEILVQAMNDPSRRYVRLVTLVDDTSFLSNEVSLKVNWSCCGAQDPKIAQAFAAALVKASDFAASFEFNGFTEVW